MTKQMEAVKLVKLIVEETKWLWDCPFRHSEYFFETAYQTVKDQRGALVSLLLSAGHKEIAEEIETKLNPENEDASNEAPEFEVWEQIASKIEAL